MSITSLLEHPQSLPIPKGHAIGIVDTQVNCDSIIRDLKDIDIPSSAVLVFGGESGKQLLLQMLKGQLWGEAAEDLLKQGTIELSRGHFVVMIEARDRDEAMTIANIAEKHGGHGFNYFGELTDEKLTR